MENETSSIAKLGIVLIALAVLIGLGFGIFQISKSVANDGITDVQEQLNSVSESKFNSYNQTTITGTMVTSAISDFEGESVAILIATQPWVNVLGDSGAVAGDYDDILSTASGMTNTYAAAEATDGVQLPVVWAYNDSKFENEYKMETSLGAQANGAFVNYNAILGTLKEGEDQPQGTTEQTASMNGSNLAMAGIYFDSNCWICTTGFGTDANGRVLYNNITGNLSKSGRTEYISSGAKFDSYLIKDSSGTTVGIAFEQIAG